MGEEKIFAKYLLNMVIFQVV